MANPGKPAVFTIPAGLPFARHIAAVLLQQYAGNLDKIRELRLLLPTRRSCRIVRDSFLQQSEGAALLLPHIQALGDVNEDELSLETAALGAGRDDVLDIPPAMPPVRRRAILTRLILARAEYAGKPEQALALADALGQLLDRIHTEGLDFQALPGLVDRSRFAEHWQLTVDFLSILSSAWPAILQENGMIDAADRRNRLIRALSRHWQDNPPQTPVIAAGSTGSIPATAELLHVIASLPQGCVILPGLDRDMDQLSWDALDDTHPQATLKNLLEKLCCNRADVPDWGVPAGTAAGRPLLSREIMRPAATTDAWRRLKGGTGALAAELEGIEAVTCATPEEEAAAIALIFRYVQHNHPMTAALITADRGLATRVAAACRRWDLEIDDSAGIPANLSPAGLFLDSIAAACADGLSPVALLTLLKNSLCGLGFGPGELRPAIGRIDSALRGPRPGPGIDGLRKHLPGEGRVIERLETALAPLLALADGREHPFADFVQNHLKAAETLASTASQHGAERLWSGDDGEAAALFFSGLISEAGQLPDIRSGHYGPLLARLMQGVSVRPRWGSHPRLAILGPLEARLVQSDLVILGGLNEGSWPPAPAADPWMSRPMRASFGLPSPERDTGLSAHDFVQGLNARRVILTRAGRQGTSPTIPSRWLQRMETALAAANLAIPEGVWAQKAAGLTAQDKILKTGRPEPRPPAEKRPVRLSVTEIETWMRDPYALYAKHVLCLKDIDNIDENPDDADRGNLVHEALESIVRMFPESLPADTRQQLCSIGHNLIQDRVRDIRTQYFWRIRFDKMADWWVSNEHTWRTRASPNLKGLEVRGTMSLQDINFTLTCKADRIDTLKDKSGVAIIDYKTGSIPPDASIVSGLSPQLALEAAMLRSGAFEEIGASPVGYLGHWAVGGNSAMGEKEISRMTPDALADEAMEGLSRLVKVFADTSTPYLSVPRPAAAPRHNPYEHLARIREWSVVDNTGGGDEP